MQFQTVQVYKCVKIEFSQASLQSCKNVSVAWRTAFSCNKLSYPFVDEVISLSHNCGQSLVHSYLHCLNFG